MDERSASAAARARHATQLALDELGTPLFATTFVVCDLETTGLSPDRDRITEIGAVKVRGGEVLGELRTFVHPGRPIPAAVTAVTGIDDAMVRDAPPIEAVLPSVLRFLQGAVFVAHNAAFDLGFLRAAARACDVGALEPSVLDTARLARRLLREELRSFRLATVAGHLRASTAPAHRALADARATVDVLHGLIERAGPYGATTVEELQELCRSRSERAFRRRDLVADAPRATGVYRFLDADDRVLYVGKATDLRERLRSYFGQDPRRRIADLVRETARVEWTVTPTLLEAEVVEVRAIHEHRPRYNRRSTRPEAAVHVALTAEAFPRLSVVREPRPSHRSTVGPLPSRRVAEQLIEAVSDVVPLRTCTFRIRRAQDHPACVRKDLGSCGAPCDGTQDEAGYEAVVAAAEAALEDPGLLLGPLRRRMAALAADGRFERAGELRSRLHGAARALADARRRDRLAGCLRLVVSRPTADGLEVAVIRRGRLAATGRLDPTAVTSASVGDLDAGALALAERLDPGTDPAPPGRDDAEEVGLVATWLDRPDVRALAVDGEFSSATRGGAALAAALVEGRRVARQVRRDRQQLAGRKVRRREGTG